MRGGSIRPYRVLAAGRVRFARGFDEGCEFHPGRDSYRPSPPAH